MFINDTLYFSSLARNIEADEEDTSLSGNSRRGATLPLPTKASLGSSEDLSARSDTTSGEILEEMVASTDALQLVSSNDALSSEEQALGR